MAYLLNNCNLKVAKIPLNAKERSVINEKSEMLPYPKGILAKMIKQTSTNQTKIRDNSETFISSVESHIQKTNAEPKLILFYNPRTYQLSRGILNKSKDIFQNCEVKKCILEFDHKLVNGSDAVIFSSIRELDIGKRPGQIWIMLQWESPQRHTKSEHPNAAVFLRNKVNWTMSYSKKADIYLPYGKVRRLPIEMRPHRNYTQIANSKTKDAVWIVSHCSTSSKREMYINILKKFISVDILGKCGEKWNCGRRRIHDQCFDFLNETYRYYLAFENSLCQDYITEKFFENYKYDIVQVVRGGDRYSRPVNISKQAYFNANDFRNAHEFGKFLKKLSTGTEAYASMLRTKDEYEVVQYMDLYRDASCEICKRLHSVDKYNSVYNDPMEWMQEKQPCYEPYDI